jgi:mRNA interferase RelE/StbE
MNFSVRIERDAFKSLSRINKQDRRKIIAAIDKLIENPDKGEQLEGKWASLRRIRVGNYRAIYSLNPTEAVILVVRIRHRGEVYRRL